MTIKPRSVAIIIGVLLVILIAVTSYQRSTASRARAADPNAFPLPLSTGIGPGTTK